MPRVAAAVAAAPAGPSAPAESSLAGLLLLAFLGGLILNLMPCVLPVLAIKVVGFTRLAAGGRRGLVAHGLAYSAGAVAAMLALAGLVLGLRAAGEQVGWGFQFQEPRFAVGVGAVLVAMALAALGVWRVGGLGGAASQASQAVQQQQAGSLARSAGEGLLAVVLATPCSAPLLGSALGAALVSPPLTVIAAFAAVGLGLALPLVLVALVPGVARLLPRPGAWMETLEHGLGFALLAAVVWLAWLVGRVAGAGGTAAALGLWLAVAFVVWLVGRAQAAERPRRPRVIGLVGLAAFVAVLGGTSWFAGEPPAARTVDSGGIRWQPWDDGAVAAELARGRAVFVDFTADWCITCKANESLTIDTDAVRAALARHDVATFRADWTRKDERIRAALARHGKAGVPMYLVYSPARPETPEVLPEVLTPGRLIEAFATARPVSLKEERP